MAKKRVHEIAKAQGLSSKELLAALKAAGVEAKAAASSVEEDAAAKAISAARGNGGQGGDAGLEVARCSQTRRAAAQETRRASLAAESRRSQSRAFDQTGAPGRQPPAGPAPAAGPKNAAS